MAHRSVADRLYQKRGRWYADFRDFSHVGGGLEALVPTGEKFATKNEDEAEILAFDRFRELRRAEEDEEVRSRKGPRLKAYSKRHLRLKDNSPNIASRTVDRDELSLRHIVNFFGDEVRLGEITTKKLTDYIDKRRSDPGSREGTTISERTIRNELNALSDLFQRAVSEDWVDQNPVRRLHDKPSGTTDTEAEFLEVGEAARLLKAAGKMDADPTPGAIPFVRPLIATYLLTGGRKHEVLGLMVADLDFEVGRVRFRSNQHRKIKNRRRRRVPLWPQLRTILREHLEAHDISQGPVFQWRGDQRVKDPRNSIADAVEAAKITKRVTLHTFRHTYGATRMQTLDNGEPVSPYTVMQELGHQSLKLIEQYYGHLQEKRHRKEVVEYVEADIVDISTRVG